MQKIAAGNFFEDFELGQTIEHATPRTVTEGDIALYLGLTGARFANHCALPAAQASGLARMPVDDLLTFHTVFGKSVADISLNAVANLGYADGRFHGLVYPGDTLFACSQVIGLRENASGKTGIVYVRTNGTKQDGSSVLDYVRWVMVRKRDPDAAAPPTVVPRLDAAVPFEDLRVPEDIGTLRVDPKITGSMFAFEDYQVGEKIDHVDGMGVMEAEHRIATRLCQNTARVHFNDHAERTGKLGAVIVYGGFVMSLARSLSFNGLGNALHLLAINGGSHVNPCVAGDTLFAWSEILDKAAFANRADAGALRLRLVAAKNRACRDFPDRQDDGDYDSSVLLDLDYWALMPRRAAFC